MDLYLAASRFSKYQSLATTLVNSCYIFLFSANAASFRAGCRRKRKRGWRHNRQQKGQGHAFLYIFNLFQVPLDSFENDKSF